MMGKIIDRVRKRKCDAIVRSCEEMQFEAKIKQAEFVARTAREMAAMQNIQNKYTDAMRAHNDAYMQMWVGLLQNSEKAKRWNEQGKAEAETLEKQASTARKWWHFWR
jgi:hypothetical protein